MMRKLQRALVFGALVGLGFGNPAQAARKVEPQQKKVVAKKAMVDIEMMVSKDAAKVVMAMMVDLKAVAKEVTDIINII